MADGFYEWRKNDGRRSTPFFVRLRSRRPFGFAGIWSMKRGEKGTERVAARPLHGYRRLHVLLRREGWQANKKLIYRLYTEETLTMCRKRPRRRLRSALHRRTVALAKMPDQCRSMDFMAGQLASGDKIRLLTIVDHFSRESPSILGPGGLVAKTSSASSSACGAPVASRRRSRWTTGANSSRSTSTNGLTCTASSSISSSLPNPCRTHSSSHSMGEKKLLLACGAGSVRLHARDNDLFL